MRFDFDTVYEDQFSYLIDGQKYLFKATLFNPDGDNLTLTKAQVKEIKLYDNIFDPWVKGEITIDNTEQSLERFRANPVDKELQPDATDIKGYTMRGDGRDVVKIEIIPLDSNNEDYDEQGEEFNKLFGLRYFFSIENETPVELDDVDCIKYTINDYDLEILSERKAFFSSAQLTDTTNTDHLNQLSNKDREAPTGKCLREILKKGLGDTTAIFSKIDPETKEQVTPNFEDGSSTIFYSSPAPACAYDDLMYVLKRHVSGSSTQDFSFLKKENHSGEYVLESASEKFSQAFNSSTDVGGKLFIENFTITGLGAQDSNIIEVEKKSPSASLEFGEKSDIIKYKFFNTSGKLYKSKIKTEAVHSYSFKDKKFNIDLVDGNILKGKEKFAENFVDGMKGKDGTPTPNLPLTRMQTQNLTFNNTFSEYGDNPDIRKAYGINKLLKNALVTNMGIEIIVKGQLLRRSGTFFSIDRVGDYIENPFDNKMLGIYFIAEVQHEFVNDTEYYNRIIGLKTYHFDDPKFQEDTV